MRALVIVAVIVVASCATSTPPTVARNDLAPSGTLRAAINYANPALARRDAASGELHGVAVDLARELGRSLDVPVDLVGYEGPAKLLAALKAGEWDVAFLAIDPARGEVTFAPAYMEVEVTYLVADGFPARDLAEVDRPGVRIAVGTANAADLFLTRELKHATLVRVASGRAGFDALRAGAADALAENRQSLTATSGANPGYRIVAGRFTTIPHAIAVPASRRGAVRYLEAFTADAKARGVVGAAIERAHLRGVVVAP